jgi:hypothetical protein
MQSLAAAIRACEKGGICRYPNRTSVLLCAQPHATMIGMIHHVQRACPAESEDGLRAFYVDVLGLQEKPKPTTLAARGGCWFIGYGIELHRAGEPLVLDGDVDIR